MSRRVGPGVRRAESGGFAALEVADWARAQPAGGGVRVSAGSARPRGVQVSFARRMSRARSVTAAVAAAIGCALVLAGCGSEHPPPAPTSGVGTVINRAMPASIRDLPLQEPNGRTTTLGDLRGRTVVVSDSMTLCSEDCPLDTANIVAAARAADAAGLTHKVVFLTVTVDPARDTPRRLAAYRELYDAQHRLPNWLLLTGTRATVTRLWKWLGVYWHRTPEGHPAARDWLTGKPLTYDVAHADEVLMFGPDGHERYVISGHADVPRARRVPRRLRGFLDRLGNRHLLRPTAVAWTPGDVLGGVSWLTGREA